MPAFTAIGAYVATTVLGLAGTAATIVGSIVATAAAFVTSRIINGNQNKGGNAGENPGGRVQVPPATNNKIPVVYGTAYVNGIITDAWLYNENKTMAYCIVLSEYTNHANTNFSIADGEILYNDFELNFKSGANSHIVESASKEIEDGQIETDTNFDNKVEVRVYAGGTAASDQIWPVGNTTPAYTYWPESKWDSSYEMSGLVFAIVKINYDADKGFTGLPAMTFKLNNALSNPADVFEDYMSSRRYGANITDLDTDALTEWRDYCDDIIEYTPTGGSGTQERYTINGVIDTSQSVKTNIDIILYNSGAWLSYDVTAGQWRPIVQRAATVAELDNALVFNDDNIISGINLSSTRLEDLYNKTEAEFYDTNSRDQKAYERIDLPSILRNPNEPDNTLRLTLDLTNNNIQANLISQIQLRQSRVDLVIEFTATHYGLQARAGDVIKVTNSIYDWTDALFRIQRIKEIEREDGLIITEISALKYDPDVYTVEPITEFEPGAFIGINPLISSYNLQKPNDDAVYVFATNNNDPVPNIVLSVEVPAEGGPYDKIQVWAAEGTTTPLDANYNLVTTHYPSPPATVFNREEVVIITITTLPANSLDEFGVRKRWYFKVRMGIGANFGNFTDPDEASPIQPADTEYTPDPVAGSAEIENIKNSILRLDLGQLNILHNNIWFMRSAITMDFALSRNRIIDANLVYSPDLTLESPYQLDLGEFIEENTVTSSTDIETFVWQVDP